MKNKLQIKHMENKILYSFNILKGVNFSFKFLSNNNKIAKNKMFNELQAALDFFPNLIFF